MLNSALDPAALAQTLLARGRLQIADALLPEPAAALHACLVAEVPWSLAYVEGSHPKTLPAERLRSLTPTERTELVRQVHAEARDGYQFMYHSYMMVSAYLAGRDPQLPLHRVLEYLNSEAFLGFARTLTGVEALRRVDAQATCYLPGDFLKRHNDEHASAGRRFAYVLNLTERWQADWGGLLQFLDQDGAVIDTFLPKWNTLSIFAVPALHCVSFVTPYAGVPRLSITGWLLDR